MAQDFYPFVENDQPTGADAQVVRHPARIAVYDDAAAAPRIVVVEPADVRTYLEEITLQVTRLAQEQGSGIPFMVIREIVENFIHAYFLEPTISILDGGDTIRFSDQGPGIAEKDRALQYGTTSATEEMRRYIRGVGSGLPYAQQYMADKGGELTIEDNIAGGTVVTLRASVAPAPEAGADTGLAPAVGAGTPGMVPAAAYGQQAWPQAAAYPQPAAWPQSGPYPPAGAYPQAPYQQQYPQQVPQGQWGAYQQGMPQAGVAQPMAAPAPAAAGWPQVTVRGRTVLDYLAAHDTVGPKELALTYGESQPTWTRELQALEAMGLIRKDGQKRRLTAMGRSMLGL